MFARQTVRATRATRNISSLVNKPSTVKESQKLFTSSHKHTYVKRSSDKIVYGALLGGFAVGMLQLVRGEVNMATGTGKDE